MDKQIEYICGFRWNDEYNKWRFELCGKEYSVSRTYHYLAKIKWQRELKKTSITKSIFEHPDMTWDIIQTTELIGLCNWSYLSLNPNITWDIIQGNPDKPWDWVNISENPNITWDIIRDNPYYPWNWIGITMNPNITWDIMRDNPYYPWNKSFMGFNPNITWVHTNTHTPRREWFYPTIDHSNPNITWDIIRNNPMDIYYWNWCRISHNPNITWDIINANPKKKWDKFHLTHNNKLTAQAQISLAKHRLDTVRQVNYLGRYVQYGLVTILLEYGY